MQTRQQLMVRIDRKEKVKGRKLVPLLFSFLGQAVQTV